MAAQENGGNLVAAFCGYVLKFDQWLGDKLVCYWVGLLALQIPL